MQSPASTHLLMKQSFSLYLLQRPKPSIRRDDPNSSNRLPLAVGINFSAFKRLAANGGSRIVGPFDSARPRRMGNSKSGDGLARGIATQRSLHRTRSSSRGPVNRKHLATYQRELPTRTSPNNSPHYPVQTIYIRALQRK